MDLGEPERGLDRGREREREREASLAGEELGEGRAAKELGAHPHHARCLAVQIEHLDDVLVVDAVVALGRGQGARRLARVDAVSRVHRLEREHVAGLSVDDLVNGTVVPGAEHALDDEIVESVPRLEGVHRSLLPAMLPRPAAHGPRTSAAATAPRAPRSPPRAGHATASRTRRAAASAPPPRQAARRHRGSAPAPARARPTAPPRSRNDPQVASRARASRHRRAPARPAGVRSTTAVARPRTRAP